MSRTVPSTHYFPHVTPQTSASILEPDSCPTTSSSAPNTVTPINVVVLSRKNHCEPDAPFTTSVSSEVHEDKALCPPSPTAPPGPFSRHLSAPITLRSRMMRTLAAIKDGKGKDTSSCPSPTIPSPPPSSPTSPSLSIPSAPTSFSATFPFSSWTKALTALPISPTTDDRCSNISSRANGLPRASLESSSTPASEMLEVHMLDRDLVRFLTKEKGRSDVLRNGVLEVVTKEGEVAANYSSEETLARTRDVLLKWWSVLLSGLPTVTCGDRGLWFDCILGIIERREFDDFDDISPPQRHNKLSATSSTSSISTKTSTTLVESDESCSCSPSEPPIPPGENLDNGALPSTERIEGTEFESYTTDNAAHLTETERQPMTFRENLQDARVCDPIFGEPDFAELRQLLNDLSKTTISNNSAVSVRPLLHQPSTTLNNGTKVVADTNVQEAPTEPKSKKNKKIRTLRRKASLFSIGALSSHQHTSYPSTATGILPSLSKRASRSTESIPFEASSHEQQLLNGWKCEDVGQLGALHHLLSRYRHLLVDTLEYAIDRLNQKGVYANVVKWSGRIMALAFFKIPGVAECLLQALPASIENIGDVANAMVKETDSASVEPTAVLAPPYIPSHLIPLRYCDLRSWYNIVQGNSNFEEKVASEGSAPLPNAEEDSARKTFEYIDNGLIMVAERLPKCENYNATHIDSLSAQGERMAENAEVDLEGKLEDSRVAERDIWVWKWWGRRGRPFQTGGNWVRRWQSDDSDLFHSFYRFYARLASIRLRSLLGSHVGNLDNPTKSILPGNLVLAMPGHAHIAGYLLGRVEALVLRRELVTVTQQNTQPEGSTSTRVLLENQAKRLARTMKQVESALGCWNVEDANGNCEYNQSVVTEFAPTRPTVASAGISSSLESRPLIIPAVDGLILPSGRGRRYRRFLPARTVDNWEAPDGAAVKAGPSLLGMMDLWVRTVICRTNVHDVETVFGLLDFLETINSIPTERTVTPLSAHNSSHLKTYSSPFSHTSLDPVSPPKTEISLQFILQVIIILLKSEHSTLLLRTLHFIYRQFGNVPTASATSSSVPTINGNVIMKPGMLCPVTVRLCCDILLDASLFEKLFCHWHRGIRNAFHRICLWRIGRMEESNALVSQPAEMVPTGLRSDDGRFGAAWRDHMKAGGESDEKMTADDQIFCMADFDGAPQPMQDITEEESNSANETMMSTAFPLLRMSNPQHREVLLLLESRVRDIRLSRAHYVTIPGPTIEHPSPESAPNKQYDISSIQLSISQEPSVKITVPPAEPSIPLLIAAPQRSHSHIKSKSTKAIPRSSSMARSSSLAFRKTFRSASLPTSAPVPRSSREKGLLRWIFNTSDGNSVAGSTGTSEGKRSFSTPPRSATEPPRVADYDIDNASPDLRPRSASPTALSCPPLLPVPSRLYPRRVDMYAARSLEEYDRGFADYLTWIIHMIHTYSLSRGSQSSSNAKSNGGSVGRQFAFGKKGQSSHELVTRIGTFPEDTEPRWMDMDEGWGGRWGFTGNPAVAGAPWTRPGTTSPNGVEDANVKAL